MLLKLNMMNDTFLKNRADFCLYFVADYQTFLTE